MPLTLTQAKPMQVHIIRCVAGGCVIGYRDENEFGEPLTKQDARRLAKAENERSERRRAQKLPGAFDYYVHSFERKTQ